MSTVYTTLPPITKELMERFKITSTSGGLHTSKESQMKRKGIDVDGYSCIEDVYSEIRGVYMEDLLKHAVGLDKKVLDSLVPDPKGVYIDGVFEPLINLDTTRCFTADGKIELFTFEDIINQPRVAVGKKLLNIAAIRRRLKDKPNYSYSACYYLIARVHEALSQLCREVHVTSNVSSQRLQHEHWVREGDVVLPSSNRIVSSVLDFIGNDTFSYYTVNLNNSTLVIHKHNDFRIVEYYRRIFDELEGDLELRFLERGY